MSESFGPRAHPERCGGGDHDPRPVRKSIEEILGTVLGVVVLIGLVGVGYTLWRAWG